MHPFNIIWIPDESDFFERHTIYPHDNVEYDE